MNTGVGSEHSACSCLLKAERSTGTEIVPCFLLWLLKNDINTDTVYFVFNLEKHTTLSFSCRSRNYLLFNVGSDSKWEAFWDAQRKQSPIGLAS